jgi:hypothetical protein
MQRKKDFFFALSVEKRLYVRLPTFLLSAFLDVKK